MASSVKDRGVHVREKRVLRRDDLSNRYRLIVPYTVLDPLLSYMAFPANFLKLSTASFHSLALKRLIGESRPVADFKLGCMYGLNEMKPWETGRRFGPDKLNV